MTKKACLGLWLCLLFNSQASEPATPLMEGDLVFQHLPSLQGTAVQLATGSPYSHVGLVLMEKGETVVCEAVQPVKMTPLAQWIRQGSNGHFVAKRPLERTRWLKPESLARLRQWAASVIGRNYDATFNWDDDRIYCSELVWKAYERGVGLKLCPMKRLGDFNLSRPEVGRILQQRYGNSIPYGEPVVSPADLFQSPLLAEVARKGKLP